MAFETSVFHRKHGKCGFQLYSLSCEHCDGRLGRYMCSSLSKGSDPVRTRYIPVAVHGCLALFLTVLGVLDDPFLGTS